jgi:hypothetical protein
LRHRRSGDGLGLHVDAAVQLDARSNAARLLDAARAVFAERGSDASLEEIAACYARWVPGSWPEPKRRGASMSTRRSTISCGS